MQIDTPVLSRIYEGSVGAVVTEHMLVPLLVRLSGVRLRSDSLSYFLVMW